MPQETFQEDFKNAIRKDAAIMGYFSHDQCAICKALKPKIETLIGEKFPLIHFITCNIIEEPMVSAEFSVFTAPTVIVWFEGKESFRFSRNMALSELEKMLQRPYSLLFGTDSM
jgi:thioredoxin 1